MQACEHEMSVNSSSFNFVNNFIKEKKKLCACPNMERAGGFIKQKGAFKDDKDLKYRRLTYLDPPLTHFDLAT